jgi:hypothetical protein
MTAQNHLGDAAIIALTLTFRGNPLQKVSTPDTDVIETRYTHSPFY